MGFDSTVYIVIRESSLTLWSRRKSPQVDIPKIRCHVAVNAVNESGLLASKRKQKQKQKRKNFTVYVSHSKRVLVGIARHRLVFLALALLCLSPQSIIEPRSRVGVDTQYDTSPPTPQRPQSETPIACHANHLTSQSSLNDPASSHQSPQPPNPSSPPS